MPQSSASIASKRSTVRARWVVAPLHPLSTACESAELSTRIVAHLDPVLARVREISARLLISEAIEGLGHQLQELVSDAAPLAVSPHEYELFRDSETLGQGPRRLCLRTRFKRG